MKTIRKAVIPAAGLGTRMLPVSKAVPKEMLPVDAKPAIQYLVEEAAAAGITDILIILGKGKEAIEHHFTRSLEYEEKLKGKKDELYAQIAPLTSIANLYFTYQHETRGLGHAISCAESFVGDEPFAVLYGDDLVISDVPCTRQLCDVYETYGKSVAGVKSVPTSDIGKYCSLKAEPIADRVYAVSDMVEKPMPEQVFTNLAILGRVVLEPCIFDLLRHTAPGAGGEIQLTDAMAQIARSTGMVAVEFEGKRYDIGNKLSYLVANVETAVKNPEYGEAFKQYLRDFVKTL